MRETEALRLGTRGSALALAQARLVERGLDSLGIGPIEEVVIETRGDRLSRRRPGGSWTAPDGQFTSDLEAALRERRVDAAVHSYKDLPTEPRSDLRVAAVPERGDARDVLIVRGRPGHRASAEALIERLPPAARIGTSSPRRAAQLSARRPDLVAVPVRGNVDTRLARLQRGEFDALVVAAAALDRLGTQQDAVRLPYDVMLPAPAQGALAVQCRSDDASRRAALERLDHAPTRRAVEAERALLRTIGGGCLAALGTLGEVHDGRLRLRAAYAHGGELVRADVTGPSDDPDAVVAAAADALRAGVAARA
ncbi:MAG TPA: hydroxymethylbilane synthase [Candidatus Limnocylindria bacterium]|nr:hydroxymethylbilane synthase [Candidatus Limnocylindria bacterium]